MKTKKEKWFQLIMSFPAIVLELDVESVKFYYKRLKKITRKILN